MMVQTIVEMRDRVMNSEENVSFAETYSLAKVLKVLCKHGEKAILFVDSKEMK